VKSCAKKSDIFICVFVSGTHLLSASVVLTRNDDFVLEYCFQMRFHDFVFETAQIHATEPRVASVVKEGPHCSFIVSVSHGHFTDVKTLLGTGLQWQLIMIDHSLNDIHPFRLSAWQLYDKCISVLAVQVRKV
jgi:hypothetical protein